MAKRDAKVKKLAQVPLFSECSNAELSRIASVADEVSFRPDRTLIKEGARGREFIVVLDGTVEVRRKGRRIPLKGGDFFGEMALLTDKPRNATVTTTSDVRALVITDRAFQSLLRDNPQIQRKVLAALAARIDDGP
jgi:CRP-like cAMP-binding protein